MCGICGLWNLDGAPLDLALLVAMRDSMAHRGPDGAGCVLFDSWGSGKSLLFKNLDTPSVQSAIRDAPFNIGLAHRRLSIIDLTTGDQPMANEDESLWVVFNGEIYNYRELRSELQAKGHVFRTQSDTEVILHAYEEWGVDSPAHFNGIFAYALWDARRRRLFLARDHFGVKPLYYCTHGGQFRFASEMKAILADGTVPRELDLDALLLCLTFRHTPSPWTLFRSIRKLEPGGFLVIGQDGIAKGHFWRERPAINQRRTQAEWIEALRETTEAAVARQMVADVPIGISLSSGVDSTTILALMAANSSGPVHAFTVGFEGREAESEIAPAREMAQRFGADFVSHVIAEREYADFMQRYLWHLEEPIGNESAAAYYFVAELAHLQGIKVLLNGQGPDEAHAGYARYLGAAYGHWFALPGGIGGKIASPLLDRLPIGETWRRFALSLTGTNLVERFFLTYSIVSPALIAELLNRDVFAQMDQALPTRYIRDQLSLAPEGSALEKMTSIDARTSLPDNLLLCEDKMAMAAGVEARVPFLDVELMTVAESMPGKHKVRGMTGKALHKEACRRWVPDDVAYRRKIGFDNAMDKWLRGALGQQLGDALARPDSFVSTYLNPQTVQRLLGEHSASFRDHQRILFLILSLESWYGVFWGQCQRSPLSG